jgi:hypothetical protein
MIATTKRLKFCLGAALVLGVSLPASGGVTYTCDATINADAYAGLCNYLNTTLASLYNSTFTNANASIYISFNSAAGLGESTTGYLNLVSYSTYQSALQTESTDSAKNFVPGTEPGLYGGGDVNLTSALANALGIAGPIAGTEYDGSDPGSGFAGAACTNPGNGAAVTASPSACYNGIITLDTPANLDSKYNQGYTYRSLGGSTTSASGGNYDIFSVIEHETDEVLGTASCYDTDNETSVEDGCGGTNIAAVDNFRYSGNGVRTINSLGTAAYFSADGGATDYEGNLYDNTANGSDWADFSNVCTFVQDGTGCPNGTAFDITTDNNGFGGAGPEVAILNAVGFNLSQQSTPEPGTLGLIGVSLVALTAAGKRLRRKKDRD